MSDDRDLWISLIDGPKKGKWIPIRGSHYPAEFRIVTGIEEPPGYKPGDIYQGTVRIAIYRHIGDGEYKYTKNLLDESPKKGKIIPEHPTT